MSSLITTRLILFISIFATVLSSCARKAIPEAPLTLEENVPVERNKDGHYILTFNQDGAWQIFAGRAPDKIDWALPLATVNTNKVIFKQFSKGQRMYFGLVDPAGNRTIVSERHIQMKGTPNFRDIGGIYTTDGRMVEWGKIYRSGKLSKLKSDDLIYMQNLNIKSVCDLRYTSEIEKDPDKLPVGAAYYHFPIGGEEGLFYQQLKKKVLKKKVRKKEAKKEFIKVMELFADSAARDFKPIMDLLKDTEPKNTPLLYHCSGGKDRTGYTTMMILATLGVDKETIRNEYLMSNFYRYKANRKVARKAVIIGIDPETLSYILVVQNEYFDAVYSIIEDKYGGMDKYLLEKFDITPAIRQQMIERYTLAPESLLPQNTN
ncbi:MAG: protein-tyrosine phosphatase [Saprospiraceae bacterium]|jgi:protein-tyrosine phosphatase